MLTVNVDWWTKKNKVLSFPHFESSIQKQVEIMTWRSTESSKKHKTQSTSSGTAARLQHCTALSTKSSLRAVRVSASWVQTAGCEWVGECFFWYGPTQVVPDQGPLNGCVCVSPDSWSYETEAVTVPLMQTRQMGQFCRCCEQSAQQTKCPHGRNTVFTSASMHTLHVLSSRNFSFSLIISAVGTESRHTVAAHDDQL